MVTHINIAKDEKAHEAAISKAIGKLFQFVMLTIQDVVYNLWGTVRQLIVDDKDRWRYAFWRTVAFIPMMLYKFLQQ